MNKQLWYLASILLLSLWSCSETKPKQTHEESFAVSEEAKTDTLVIEPVIERVPLPDFLQNKEWLKVRKLAGKYYRDFYFDEIVYLRTTVDSLSWSGNYGSEYEERVLELSKEKGRYNINLFSGETQADIFVEQIDGNANIIHFGHPWDDYILTDDDHQVEILMEKNYFLQQKTPALPKIYFEEEFQYEAQNEMADSDKTVADIDAYVEFKYGYGVGRDKVIGVYDLSTNGEDLVNKMVVVQKIGYEDELHYTENNYSFQMFKALPNNGYILTSSAEVTIPKPSTLEVVADARNEFRFNICTQNIGAQTADNEFRENTQKIIFIYYYRFKESSSILSLTEIKDVNSGVSIGGRGKTLLVGSVALTPLEENF